MVGTAELLRRATPRLLRDVIPHIIGHRLLTWEVRLERPHPAILRSTQPTPPAVRHHPLPWKARLDRPPPPTPRSTQPTPPAVRHPPPARPQPRLTPRTRAPPRHPRQRLPPGNPRRGHEPERQSHPAIRVEQRGPGR